MLFRDVSMSQARRYIWVSQSQLQVKTEADSMSAACSRFQTRESEGKVPNSRDAVKVHTHTHARTHARMHARTHAHTHAALGIFPTGYSSVSFITSLLNVINRLWKYFLGLCETSKQVIDPGCMS